MKPAKLKTRFFTFASAVGLTLALGSIVPASAAEPPAKLNMSLNPPAVSTASLLRTGDADQGSINAQLFVTFRNRTLAPLLTINVGDGSTAQSVPLRDDGVAPDRERGDRTYTAQLAFDFAAFDKEQSRRNELAARSRTVPVFSGRRRLSTTTLIAVEPVKVGQAIDLTRFPGIPLAVIAANELVITDPGVVNDPTRTFDVCTGIGNPNGVWTFSHLMTEMANQPVTGIDPADFTRRWLQQWETTPTPNVNAVAARLQIQNLVINPWPLTGAGKLDMAQAPFRLLAIVNRVDLRTNTTYGSGNAGEARFVFGVLDRNNCGSVPQFTVIFEYGINKSGCFLVRNWGQQWHNLGALALGSAAYNAALEAITLQFTERNLDPTKLPNRSALNQLRTNENALNPLWELREFRIFNSDSDAGHLRETTVKQTPNISLNNTAPIRDYINANASAIIAGTNAFPLFFPNVITPFLAGSTPTPFGMFWNGPAVITNANARHPFSLNTCNGCHAGETNTIFTHIKPRTAAAPAALSGFMTGINVTDPVSSVVRNFNENLRRAQDLDSLVNTSCLISGLTFRPILATH